MLPARPLDSTPLTHAGTSDVAQPAEGKTLVSNSAFDRGSLSPTYVKLFEVFAKGSETGDGLTSLDNFRNWLGMGLQPAKADEHQCAALTVRLTQQQPGHLRDGRAQGPRPG
jgi:hypothetical protein